MAAGALCNSIHTFFIILTLLTLLATFAIALPSDMAAAGPRVVPSPADIPYTTYNDSQTPVRGTSLINWGRQSSKLEAAMHQGVRPDDDMPLAHCFGAHGIANTFMDHAVALFCNDANGLVLDLKMPNNSVAMTYAYWPPARNPGKDYYDCGETGQVYLQIGFGLGAPSDTSYTLSTSACVRGLQTVYNVDCDGQHKDNKHGGQLDLGAYKPQIEDKDWNDHLFYLADPNPPLEGRNPYCSNGMWRFTPNAENTNFLPKQTDNCYDVHLGFGGDDKWSVKPKGWKPSNNHFDADDMKAHSDAKEACVKLGGKYDKKGGTGDNLPGPTNW
ncbi:hypothetical protein LTR95_001402 [Oleoguttula sp. CCFEE 5521]